ncbi:MAG: hypothetical protein ACJ0SL_00455 [Candidatus Rariloculaceae bacterium]
MNAVLQHYDNPNGEVDDFFDNGAWCDLDQFEDIANCQALNLYPNAEQNTNQALNKRNQERNQNDPAALENINLNNGEINDLEEFLETLTDPCATSRACLAPWIPSAVEAADAHQLNAIGGNANPL